MKKLVRRVPAHTVRSFQCEVCGTKYRTANQAKKCEARVQEEKVFGKMDVVRILECRICSHMGKDRPCRSFGRIEKVIGPMLPDYEYEVKWLGGKAERLNGHVYLYLVRYLCKCRRVRADIFRAPELRLLKRSR